MSYFEFKLINCDFTKIVLSYVVFKSMFYSMIVSKINQSFLK